VAVVVGAGLVGREESKLDRARDGNVLASPLGEESPDDAYNGGAVGLGFAAHAVSPSPKASQPSEQRSCGAIRRVRV
jgi:hypothetical protein